MLTGEVVILEYPHVELLGMMPVSALLVMVAPDGGIMRRVPLAAMAAAGQPVRARAGRTHARDK